MRLWHKDLITVLPRQQLLAQWRECCAIAKNIAVNGTPNHILVNPIMDYKITSFASYCIYVIREMERRGYKISSRSISKCEDNLFLWSCNELKPQVFRLLSDTPIELDRLFEGWHNKDYLTQCFYNLQEKYQRGGMGDVDWMSIHRQYNRLMYFKWRQEVRVHDN